MSKTNIGVAQVLQLSAKLTQEWDTTPLLFADSQVTRAEFAAKVTTTTAAAERVRSLRTEHKGRRISIDNEYQQAVAAAKAKATAEKAALTAELNSALDDSNVKAKDLSRIANSLRYTAKARALGNDIEEDDAAGKRL